MKHRMMWFAVILMVLACLSGCGKKDDNTKAKELFADITRPDSAGYTYLAADVSISYRDSEREDVTIGVVADRAQMNGVRHLERCSVVVMKGKEKTSMGFEAWADGSAVYLKQTGGQWEQSGAGSKADEVMALDFDKAVSFLVGASLSYGADKAVVTTSDMDSVIEWDTSWRNVADIFAGQPDCTALPEEVHVAVSVGADGRPSKLVIETDPEDETKVHLSMRIVSWGGTHEELAVPESVTKSFNKPEVSVEKPAAMEQAANYAGSYERPEGFADEELISYADKAALSGVPFDGIKLASEDGYNDMQYYSHGEIGIGGMWFSVLELERHGDPAGGLDRYNAMCEFNEAWFDGCETNQYGLPYGWLLCRAWYITDQPDLEYKLDICGVLDDGSVLELQVESYLSDGITFEMLAEKADELLAAIGLSTEYGNE